MAICGPFFIVKVYGAVVKIYRYALCRITDGDLMSFTALWQRKCDLICVFCVVTVLIFIRLSNSKKKKQQGQANRINKPCQSLFFFYFIVTK